MNTINLKNGDLFIFDLVYSFGICINRNALAIYSDKGIYLIINFANDPYHLDYSSDILPPRYHYTPNKDAILIQDLEFCKELGKHPQRSEKVYLNVNRVLGNIPYSESKQYYTTQQGKVSKSPKLLPDMQRIRKEAIEFMNEHHPEHMLGGSVMGWDGM